MRVNLQEALRSRTIWRGQESSLNKKRLTTGLPALDAILPDDGWPLGALTEIFIPQAGIGELQFLLPALSPLSQNKYVACINPPYPPYAPALAASGFKLSHLLLIRPPARHLLWTAEQVLRSGACAAALAWLEEIDFRASRRLQLAAETGLGSGFVFLEKLHPQPSAAALRLSVSKQGGQTSVHILKGRNARGLSAAV